MSSLTDSSCPSTKGQRVENFIASHLLKSVHFWTDLGYGEYQLFYLRDKDKREVDFLVTKDKKPWFLVAAKSSSHDGVSKSLEYFYKELGAKYAFQVVFDMPYVDSDCFKVKKPTIVPASTFLSQIV